MKTKLPCVLCALLPMMIAQHPNAQTSWKINGNAGTNPNTNFLGTTDAKALNIRTNNICRILVTRWGDVGIGNLAPLQKLDVNGNINIAGGSAFYINNERVIHATGVSNFFAGPFAGNSIAPGGFGNTATGLNALRSTTTGFQNTASGLNALGSNTTGADNTGYGVSSLSSNTTGSSNTASGSFSLFSNTTGTNNTASGNNALSANTAGNNNTASGSLALFSNATADNNTACGYKTLYSSTTGTENTAVGALALYTDGTGSWNTALGNGALYYNNYGSFNSATGYKALYYNTSGTQNAAHGNFALFTNTTGSNNTGSGFQSLYFNETGNANTAAGVMAGPSSGSFSNTTALGFHATTTASNQVRIGNSSVTSIGGYVNWSNISDGRFKKNVKDNVKGLAFIMKLRPVSYNLDISGLNSFLNKNIRTPDGKTQSPSATEQQEIRAKEQTIYSGFIAQDVERIAKETGYEFSGVDAPKNDNDVYALRYADFVVPLVKAVQELEAENEALRARLDKIEQMLSKNNPQQTVGANDIAALEQNMPNPFNQSTIIKYRLPQNAGAAFVKITDMNGTLIKTIALSTNGKGQVVLPAGNLPAGTYQYSLFVNEKLVDTKKMILTK